MNFLTTPSFGNLLEKVPQLNNSLKCRKDIPHLDGVMKTTDDVPELKKIFKCKDEFSSLNECIKPKGDLINPQALCLFKNKDEDPQLKNILNGSCSCFPFFRDPA